MHPEEVLVHPLSYEASIPVCDSDHKPLSLTLDLTVPGFDQAIKRKASFEALSLLSSRDRSLVYEAPTLVLTRDPHQPQGTTSLPSAPHLGQVPLLHITGAPSRILVTNTSNSPALVSIGSYGDYQSERLKLPSWLEVTPASFLLEAQGIKEVLIRASHADTIYAQQYPLEATVEFMAQNAVMGVGMGGWRGQGKDDRGRVVVAIDAHP